MQRLLGVIALATLLVACGESMGDGDAGPTDGGALDATTDDAGSDDAGSGDAGSGDAGSGDAGSGDAGSDDAGSGDAGAGDGGLGDAGIDDAGIASDGGLMDAGPPACLATDLVIAAIDPGTPSGPGAGSIAIYNASASAVDIDSSEYRLHEDPDTVLLRSLASGVVIPAGGLHRFPYPAAFSDGNASGEMALYRDAALTSPASLIDFVCWGFGHSSTFSVRSVAEADGDWSGACAPGISGLEMRRITGTDGTTRASYDTTGLTALFECP